MYVLRVCVGCAFCVVVLWCAVSLCVVLVLVLVRNEWCVYVQKRFRVYWQNARMCSLSFSLPSFSSSVLFLFLFLFSSLSLLFSLSSLPATMTMITRAVGSLCVHKALTCLSITVRGLRSSPCLANMFVSCARNNCPGITVQASYHLE